MFNLITLSDTIRIDPSRFGQPLEAAAFDELQGKYEGLVDDDLGYVISVIGLSVDPFGRILPGDGGTHHSVKFSILTFFPQMQEIIEGEVVEVADFGTFLRIGPVDALLHVSQLMDDFISYDEKQGVLLGSHHPEGGHLQGQDRRRLLPTRQELGKDRGDGPPALLGQARLDQE